jgi:thiamine-phosphate pyrophosphorylase
VLDSRLYLVCDARPGGRPLADVLVPALAGGVDLFQLRMKDADDAEILAAAEIAADLCQDAGVPFILNDRPELVEAAGAAGVHVGQDDTPVEEARTIAGAGAIVGLSTHSVAQVDDARTREIDYFAVGPVHATPTKLGRPAIGLDPIRHAAQVETVRPWFAIGGLDLDTTQAVLDAGATRIVVVRAIAEADDPGRAARSLRAVIEAAA